MSMPSETASILPLECCKTFNQENGQDSDTNAVINVWEISPLLVEKLVYDALVWSSLHGLVVGDKRSERSGTLPGVGLVHAPFSLLPTPFPSVYWSQACELAPIFNELVDRVSLDGAFLQESLPRTKKIDAFTSRLLDIHMQMQGCNNKENRTTLHRSDYMLDYETKALLQVELNTISSFAGLSCLVSELHSGQEKVAVVYFRVRHSPNDYPCESEWRGTLLIEQSNATKCPSISYHLVGTKKIQQELAKPDVLESFPDNKDDVLKLRKCFAGLWSLDDSNVVQDALARPELFVLKPQREGGGNNIYGEMVREKLVELQQGSEGLAAFILMQRIFPTNITSFLVRDGSCHQGQTLSELGIFGAYLRVKDKVILNDHCGYLMRTKVSSSDEGGVAAGFVVLDSVYVT